MDWDKDVHASGSELLMHDLALLTKLLAILASGYVFFGATYLPGCDITSVVTQPLLAFFPIAALAALMGKFTTYGVAWTPYQRKYEFSQAGFSLALAAVLIVGWLVNRQAMTHVMWFAGGLFGLMVVLEFLLDFVGRLVRRRRILAARAPTSPSTP